jgi:hypothetical protein
MSDFEILRQSSNNIGAPPKTRGAQTVLTDTMLRYLREASPWLMFIGVLGFIGCGFLFAGGIVFAITMFIVEDFADEWGGFFTGFLGLIYAVLGVVSFFPARFIYFFGAKIRDYQLSNSEQKLEDAFKNNKAFWKFTGIFCIIYLAFIPLGIIIGIVVAINFAFM